MPAKLIALCDTRSPTTLEEAAMLDKSPQPPAVNVPNDLAAHWMPFTANRAIQKGAAAARRRQGHALHDRRRPPDASTAPPASGASMPATAAPRSPPRSQARPTTLDYAPAVPVGPSRWPSSSPSALAELAPGDLDHVFFSNSGSEAVDTALKIALAYHRSTARAPARRLIGRERGYHGVGFGGIVRRRHRRQPQAVRDPAAGRRSPAAHP